MSMKNSNDFIGNRNRDLPAYSGVPQPTAPPAACPLNSDYKIKNSYTVICNCWFLAHSEASAHGYETFKIV